jgi:hypothetical protein
MDFVERMEGPFSLYSFLEIHIVLKVAREDRIDPPIQVEYSLSGGAAILIFVSFGRDGWRRISLRSRSPKPRGRMERREGGCQ